MYIRYKIQKRGTSLGLSKLFMLVLLSAFLSYCGNGKKPFVSIDGTKYTESDLKKELPDYYSQIKNEYDEQVKRGLERLIEKKIFALAAKERKMPNGDAYMNSLNSNSTPPSDEEIKKTYQELQSQGQLKGQSMEAVRGQIVNYLQSLKSRGLVQAEASVLRKKYKVYSGPEDRKEVKISGKPTWNPLGKVLVVEFSGYDCPYCKRVQATAKLLKEKYAQKVKWVFKDYPLNPGDIHHHVSLNCLFDQSAEKFFLLFEKIYSVPDTRAFVEKANLDKQIEGMGGVDMKRYKACTESPVIKERIMEDYREGQSLGVRGIPHFFINGKSLSGAQPIEAFEQLINAEL